MAGHLVRTAMGKSHMRQLAMLLLQLAIKAAVFGVTPAAVFYSSAATSMAAMAMEPSRR